MFWSLMMTGAVIEFSQVGAAFIDGLIISRFLGAEAMAGEGIALPIYSIVGVISGPIATGMQITCSQLLGRGKVKEVNRFFSQALYVGIAMSVLMTAPILIFSKQFAVLLGAKGNAADLVGPAAQYLFGNEEAISEVKTCEWKNTAIFSTAICAILLVFAKPIAHMYVAEEGELFNMVVFATRILGLQTALQTLIKSRISYLQAISRTMNMNLLVFSSQLVFIILSAFVLGRLFGVYGILSSFVVSDVLSLLAVYVLYQLKFKTPFPKKELLNLPEEFRLHPGDVISLDIRNMDDVSSASEQIQMFCKGHKYNSKIGLYSSLAFEELAANIIQYGFPMNKKKSPIIDLRVVALDDRLVVRIRDDCPHFDITKRIAEITQDNSDPASQLGIRITSKIAKNIEYTHAFETNNIIITYDDPKSALKVK